ncbi:MAG: 30S ribosomal protein S20 [Chloroflexi bacterium]|nr:MAG: 30S ribosomal protein S20 [Chloroflexota bacterium]HEY67733.1 30S ribosomal protein S20 [Thermoflexia bacterium]
MANTKSAIKRLRSARRRRVRNRIYRGRARTAIKKARRLMDEGRLEEAREAVRVAVSALDKAAEKGIIHKNNAARRKSRLMRRLNRIESTL